MKTQFGRDAAPPTHARPAANRAHGDLLNLGCGARFDPTWTNIDMVSTNQAVLGHDLRTGIPFADGSFRVVYHSHMLEHLPRSQALPFLCECFRVLQPGGTIRVVVPDLEEIARLYIRALEASIAGDRSWRQNYEWLMLELFDQAIREQPMGEMQPYLSQAKFTNHAFIASRSADAQRLMAAAERTQHSAASAEPTRSHTAQLRHRISLVLRNPRLLRERLVRLVLGNEYELLKIGRFRRSGEIHHWMYDRYSLAQLLINAGFRDPQAVGAAESRITDWSMYHLDTEPDGSTYKPDSLFMEAIRP